MFTWSTYIEGRMQDLMTEAEAERLLKTAVSQARTASARRPLRDAIGERLILLGWRMMNRAPEQGETCSRLVLSGDRQALVMVEVCP